MIAAFVRHTAKAIEINIQCLLQVINTYCLGKDMKRKSSTLIKHLINSVTSRMPCQTDHLVLRHSCKSKLCKKQQGHPGMHQ